MTTTDNGTWSQLTADTDKILKRKSDGIIATIVSCPTICASDWEEVDYVADTSIENLISNPSSVQNAFTDFLINVAPTL